MIRPVRPHWQAHARLVPSSTRLAGQQRRQVALGVTTTLQKRVGLPLGEPRVAAAAGRAGAGDDLAPPVAGYLRPATGLTPSASGTSSCRPCSPPILHQIAASLVKRWPLHTTSAGLQVDYGKGNREVSTPIAEDDFGK